MVSAVKVPNIRQVAVHKLTAPTTLYCYCEGLSRRGYMYIGSNHLLHYEITTYEISIFLGQLIFESFKDGTRLR